MEKICPKMAFYFPMGFSQFCMYQQVHFSSPIPCMCAFGFCSEPVVIRTGVSLVNELNKVCGMFSFYICI